jgi:hypothetical protein
METFCDFCFLDGEISPMSRKIDFFLSRSSVVKRSPHKADHNIESTDSRRMMIRSRRIHKRPVLFAAILALTFFPISTGFGTIGSSTQGTIDSSDNDVLRSQLGSLDLGPSSSTSSFGFNADSSRNDNDVLKDELKALEKPKSHEVKPLGPSVQSVEDNDDDDESPKQSVVEMKKKVVSKKKEDKSNEILKGELNGLSGKSSVLPMHEDDSMLKDSLNSLGHIDGMSSETLFDDSSKKEPVPSKVSPPPKPLGPEVSEKDDDDNEDGDSIKLTFGDAPKVTPEGEATDNDVLKASLGIVDDVGSVKASAEKNNLKDLDKDDDDDNDDSNDEEEESKEKGDDKEKNQVEEFDNVSNDKEKNEEDNSNVDNTPEEEENEEQELQPTEEDEKKQEEEEEEEEQQQEELQEQAEEIEQQQEEQQKEAEELAKETEEEEKNKLLDEQLKHEELQTEVKKAEEKSKLADTETKSAEKDAHDAEKTMEEAAKAATQAAKLANETTNEEEKTKALATADEAAADAEEASLKAAEKMEAAAKLKRESEIREALAAADEARTIYDAAKVHMSETETEMNKATEEGDLDLVEEIRLRLEKEKTKTDKLLADAKKKQEYAVKLISDAKEADDAADEESFLKKMKQHLKDTILEQDSNGFRGVSPALSNSKLLIPDLDSAVDQEGDNEEDEEMETDPWISEDDRKTLYGTLLLVALTCVVTIMMVCFNERTKIVEKDNDEDGSSKEQDEDVEFAPGTRMSQVVAFHGKLGAVYLRTTLMDDGVKVRPLNGYQQYSHPTGYHPKAESHQLHELVLLRDRVSKDVPMFADVNSTWGMEIHSETYPNRCVYLQPSSRKAMSSHFDADVTCSRGVDVHLVIWKRLSEDQHKRLVDQGWLLEVWHDDKEDEQTRNRSVGRYRLSKTGVKNYIEYPESMYVKKLAPWERLEYDFKQNIEHCVFFTPTKRKLKLAMPVLIAVLFSLAGALILGIAVKDYT